MRVCVLNARVPSMVVLRYECLFAYKTLNWSGRSKCGSARSVENTFTNASWTTLDVNFDSFVGESVLMDGLSNTGRLSWIYLTNLLNDYIYERENCRLSMYKVGVLNAALRCRCASRRKFAYWYVNEEVWIQNVEESRRALGVTMPRAMVMCDYGLTPVHR